MRLIGHWTRHQLRDSIIAWALHIRATLHDNIRCFVWDFHSREVKSGALRVETGWDFGRFYMDAGVGESVLSIQSSHEINPLVVRDTVNEERSWVEGCVGKGEGKEHCSHRPMES